MALLLPLQCPLSNLLNHDSGHPSPSVLLHLHAARLLVRSALGEKAQGRLSEWPAVMMLFTGTLKVGKITMRQGQLSQCEYLQLLLHLVAVSRITAGPETYRVKPLQWQQWEQRPWAPLPRSRGMLQGIVSTRLNSARVPCGRASPCTLQRGYLGEGKARGRGQKRTLPLERFMNM